MKFVHILISIVLISATVKTAENPGLTIKSVNFYNNTGKQIAFEITIDTASLNLTLFDGEKTKLPEDLIRIKGRIEEKKINEDDILFSQYARDINMDGDTDDVFDIYASAGHDLIFNGKKVLPIKSTHQFRGMDLYQFYDNINGNLRETKINQGGLPLLFYSFNKKDMSVEIGFPKNSGPIKNIEVPNPSIEISLKYPNETPDIKNRLKISGTTMHNIATKGFNEGSDTWTIIESAYYDIKSSQIETLTIHGSILNPHRGDSIDIRLMGSPSDGIILYSRTYSFRVIP